MHGWSDRRAVAFVGMIGCGLALAPAEGRAHGSMEVPISRVYNCFLEGPEAPKSAACRAVVAAGGTQPLYDWMEVNQFEANGRHHALIADGTLCAGGREKYVGLDLKRRDWPTTAITPDGSGKFTFVFHAMTPHATDYFRFYITRDGWSPAKRLGWGDLAKFAEVKAPTAVDNRYRMTVKLPPGKTGRRLVYVIWQRSDSAEAFYSCSDVKILEARAETSAAGWNEAGRLIAKNDLKVGSTVSFRVFNPDGSDVERHTVVVGPDAGDAAAWPKALAEAVNAKSRVFRIGTIDGGGKVTPVAAAAGNIVYRGAAHDGFSYAVDIDTP
jgi:chitin-binding protein